MPLNTTSLPNFAAGTVIEAAQLRDRFDTIQQFINGQVGSAELATTPWVDSQHVVQPEFYGAPSPRTISTSFHTWHRRVPHEKTNWSLMYEDYAPATIDALTGVDSGPYTPVPGSAATIHVPPIDTGGTVGLAIWCNWYAWTSGGTFSAVTDVEYPSPAHDHIAARFKLFVDDTGYTATQRDLYAASTFGGHEVKRLARKNHSATLWVPSISPGVHSVSLRVAVFPAPATRNWKSVWVGLRSLEVEIFLL